MCLKESPLGVGPFLIDGYHWKAASGQHEFEIVVGITRERVHLQIVSAIECNLYTGNMGQIERKTLINIHVRIVRVVPRWAVGKDISVENT